MGFVAVRLFLRLNGPPLWKQPSWITVGFPVCPQSRERFGG